MSTKVELPNTPEGNIEEVSDSNMLLYLIKESGKTKDEIATEIRERFWTYDELQAFFDKP